MGKKVSYEINERGVAVCTISNPPMNALDEITILELESAFREMKDDEKVKVVVFTGEGPTFIVGADVKKVQEVQTREEGERVTRKGQEIFGLIENMRKPVIAAINGACLGGGTEFAVACHLRIAGDQVQMGLPEILLGIMPGFGGTQRCARLLGTARALEIMLTGKFVDMREAERIGLVNRVVPQDRVLAEALDLAKNLSYKPPLAMAAILEAVIDGTRMSLDEGLKLESRCFGMLAETEDKREGIAAFLEKRRAAFKGK